MSFEAVYRDKNGGNTATLDEFFDRLSVAYCCFNQSGALAACNSAFARLFGLDDKKEALLCFETFFTASSREIIKRNIVRVLASGSSRFGLSCTDRSGEELYLEMNLVKESNFAAGHVINTSRFRKSLSRVIENEREVAEINELMLEAAPFATNIWSDDFRPLDCNRQFLELFGLNSKKEYFTRIGEMSPKYQPDGTLSHEHGIAALKKVLKDGYSRYEFTMHNLATGEPIPLEISMTRVQRKGKPLVVSYLSDLRLIKAAEKRRNEELRRWRTILDSLPIGVNVTTQDGQMTDCNETICEQFDFPSKGEYIERFLETFMEYQSDGSESLEKLGRVLEQAWRDGGTKPMEWLMKTAKGEFLPLSISSRVINFDDGPLLVTYTQDLRPIYDAMEKMREGDERSALLLRTMPMACAMVNAERETIDCNQAAIDLLAKQPGMPFEYTSPSTGEVSSCDGNCDACASYRKDTCVARICLIKNWRHTISRLLDDPERAERAINGVYERVESEGSLTFSLERLTLYGEKLYCEVTMVPVIYLGKKHYALYIRDLRESRLRELAEEESRAKSQFLARMSHEIRTPMNAVLGITEIQLQKGSHTPETEEAFLRIHSSSSMLLAIINDILDMSKVEAGKMEIIPVDYDFAEMVVNTVQLNLMYVGSKHIDFKLTVDESLPSLMFGDEVRIKQVLNNLLSNAFKYTLEGHVSLSLTKREIPESEDVMLVIEVSDSGQGMTKEQLTSLFEIEFNRYNLQINREVEGSGLGMTITYYLVRLMDGNIDVESEPGKGTTFTVRIPQKVARKDVLGKELAENLQNLDAVKNSLKTITKIERESMPYGRVLVVDDVESNLFVAKGLLLPYKLRVETAISGYEAVELVKAGEVYDIIFMDHMMPGIDGIEAVKIIREAGYDAPIVALTANIVSGQAELFMANGFSGFVSKPIDANHLDSYLTRFIRDKQPPEILAAAAANGTDDSEEPGISAAIRESFLRDAKKVKESLADFIANKAFDEKSVKLYTINTHAMKSALANIGEAELSEAAYALEEAGRANDLEKIRTETGPFLERLQSVIDANTPDEEPDMPDCDPDFLRQRLVEIHEACEEYRRPDARKALFALADKTWSKRTQALISKISEHILHSDFEAAAEAAKDGISG